MLFGSIEDRRTSVLPDDVDRFCKVADQFLQSLSDVKIEKVVYLQSVVVTALSKYLDDMLVYTNQHNRNSRISYPDEFKEAAHLAFWIRRLRPLVYLPDEGEMEFINTHLNESFALWLAFFICENKLIADGYDTKKQHISKKLEGDLKVFMRYKHISPHALMIMLRVAYGFDPKELKSQELAKIFAS